jgi:flagellar basal-body rod protein FlgF
VVEGKECKGWGERDRVKEKREGCREKGKESMANILTIALARRMNLRNEMDVVAHNLANVNTAAYKGEQLLFRDFLERTNYRESYITVQDYKTFRNTTEGSLRTTNNPLDVAIQGEGFFSVQGDVGIRYSRQGQFSLDLERNLVNSSGYQVLDEGQAAITIPVEATDITVAPDGTISSQIGIIGRIGVVTFDDVQDMDRAESGHYITDQAPIPIEVPTLVQGMLEESNIQPILEITKMMEILRETQRLQKTIDEQHERIKKMVEKIGSPSQ